MQPIWKLILNVLALRIGSNLQVAEKGEIVSAIFAH